MKPLSITLILFSVCLFNCANDSTDDLLDSTPLPNIVTYNDDVKTIIDNNCISCHANTPNSGASVSLTTYNNVKSAVQNNNLIGKINGTASGGLMPLGGPKLPQNLIDLIEKWETDGLLEN
ncbi:hypothetical protein RBH94_10800 [Aestuariibaculum sp. YM273]|uniref:hypothetical protein n=1 Tax=Aestuariibaculum sp. YM273 TaxID=3070659 RepID=UPI0027DB84E0|nr:hypothetical protein [Aestuariibaculum sp. YM273]WMI64548.1 hypothetical protein RBH94_10800 [Aestuariibaculum sp. YM273]